MQSKGKCSSVLAALGFAAGVFLCPVAMAVDVSDNVSIDDLKKAFGESAPAGEVRKPRTRAIVFDGKAADPAPAAAEPAAPAGGEAKKAGGGINLRVSFAPGSAKISPESFKSLDVVAQFFGMNQDRYVIEGHSDASGNADKNMALSADRATAVKEYLIKQGVAADRLSAIGKGSSEPLEGEDPRSPKNRRVQFKRAG